MGEDEQIKISNFLPKDLPESAKIMARAYYKDYQGTKDQDKKARLANFYKTLFKSQEALALYKKLTKKLEKPHEVMKFITIFYGQYERVETAGNTTRAEENSYIEDYITAINVCISRINRSFILEDISDRAAGKIGQKIRGEKGWNLITEGLSLELFEAMLNEATDAVRNGSFEKEINHKVNYSSSIKSKRYSLIRNFELRAISRWQKVSLPSKELYDIYMLLFPAKEDKDEMSYDAYRKFRSELKL